MSNTTKKNLFVYSVTENVNAKTGEAKSFWNRVGVAFTNRDGSLNIVLNALPLNGKLHVREQTEKDDMKSMPQTESDFVASN